MRKITKKAIAAFMGGYNFSEGNTTVTVEPDVTTMSLFGNSIAWRYNDYEKQIYVSNAGWQSNTTKERLNSIPGVRISQKNYQWYLNGQPWDGKKKLI